MNNITFSEYRKEIEELATCLVDDAIDALEYDKEEITRESVEDIIMDSLLHETIDGHQWVIYYAYNDEVLTHTEFPEAYQDVYSNEDLGQLVAEKGFDSAKMVMAFYAMYNDVLSQIDWAIGEKFSN